MRVERGASQVLFGFLPGQTVDLEGRVWRVVQWQDPPQLPLDQEAVRRAVLAAAGPWCGTGNHDGVCDQLLGGGAVEVVELNRRLGAEVESFPRLWRCRSCGRIGNRQSGRCACGADRRSQIHYVAYHSCGAMQEPPIPRCPRHNDVALELPGSAAARDLRFYCPQCNTTLNRGFPYRPCSCGDGGMERTVHRAAAVFTPRFTVLVNPPDPAKAAQLRAGGGAVRCLEWVVDGMSGNDPSGGRQTVAGLIEALKRAGLPEETARDIARDQLGKGTVRATSGVESLRMTPAEREWAEEEAISLASAVGGGRRTVTDMQAKVGPPLRTLYESGYRAAIDAAKLEGVDFLPSFPVVTLAFGYTRGDPQPGVSRLIAFRDHGRLRAYGDSSPTEALLFRLDPLRVHAWLVDHRLIAGGAAGDARAARVAILEQALIPRPTDEHPQPSGAAILELVHSYAHRAIRRMAAFAGTERDSLGEYLLPHHLAFVIYAATKGDFVLGGLQALFESLLDRFLTDFLRGEHRCPLDPGCRNGGGACMACLHLGESSCRWYNRFLDRARLFGPGGFLR